MVNPSEVSTDNTFTVTTVCGCGRAVAKSQRSFTEHSRYQVQEHKLAAGRLPNLTCNSALLSKLYALGRPSRVLNATLAPLSGEMSLKSSRQIALASSSRDTVRSAGMPYVARHDEL